MLDLAFLVSFADADTAMQTALLALSPAELQGDSGKSYLIRGEVYRIRGQQPQAHAAYDSLRAVLRVRVRAQGSDEWVYRELGFVEARLGNREAAVRDGERAASLLPVAQDALNGALNLGQVAGIYATAGAKEAAIQQLGYLLSIPSFISVPALRVDPMWDPLRSNPRFDQLVAGK